MIEPPLDALLDRLSHSSRRLRIAMALTAGLCALIAAGIASDASLWRSGPGWQIAGAAGVIAFGALALLAAYSAIRGQRRHTARLRRLLVNQPRRIRVIRLQVARAVPHASWSADDGTATTGLHVMISDDGGATWILPVSRSEAPALVDALARLCPLAVVEP